MSRHDWEDCYAGLGNGFQTPEQERRQLDEHAGGGAANYGEILPQGVRTLCNWLRPGPEDLLLDLGSGCGRLLIQALCSSDLGQAVGIEGLAHRHTIALRAREALAARDPRRAAALQLHCGDFCDLPLPSATLVYIGATCFPDPLLARLAARLRGLPRLRRLICTRPLPAPQARVFPAVGQLRLDMSWTEAVPVDLYGPPRPPLPTSD